MLDINGGGWLKVLIGAALIVAGAFTTPVGIGAALIGAGGAIIASDDSI
jgi:predicted phage tail protein